MNKYAPNPLITEELIKQVVHHFYGAIQSDERLGPIFAHHIQDWDHHLEIMCNFWSSITLKTARFNGRPMMKHQLLATDVTPEDFKRWLALFEQTLHDIVPIAAHPDFLMPAQNIAMSLQIGMFEVPFDAAKVREQLQMHG